MSTETTTTKVDQEVFHLQPDYFRWVHPMLTALIVGAAWIVLPILAFNADLLSPIMGDALVKVAEKHHYNLIKLFNVHIWLHMIECIVTMQKCRKLGINADTTLKWMANVAVHGIFALKFLIWPGKDANKTKVH